MRKLLRRLDAYTLTALNPAPRGPAPRATEPRAVDRQRRRVERQQRRLDRERRRLIAAELAEYRTPAERTELELILARSADEDVREIADLLPRRGVH